MFSMSKKNFWATFKKKKFPPLHGRHRTLTKLEKPWGSFQKDNCAEEDFANWALL